MNTIDLLLHQLTSSVDTLKATLGDFSDADLMVRPCPGANHPLWQLGHLIKSEAAMINMVKPGLMPELPAGFAEKFDKKAAGIDDPKHFGVNKNQLLDLLTKVHAATVAFTKSLKLEDLNKPGPEPLRSFAPTVGDLIGVQAAHVSMHVGQMQVARRKLGKPILF